MIIRRHKRQLYACLKTLQLKDWLTFHWMAKGPSVPFLIRSSGQLDWILEMYGE